MSAAAITQQISAALDAARTNSSANNPLAAAKTKSQAAARGNAESFEATFLSSMFQQMFTETEGEGPMGGGAGAGVWRSFLTDEFAKSFAKNGGIGLAEPVYRSLLMHQEAASAQ
jgi:Rod binding domain-containing protein